MTVQTFLDGCVTLISGDCIEALRAMPENSVDAAVMDPPYHLTSVVDRFGDDNTAEAKGGKTGVYKRASAGFMGKRWDGGDIAFRVETWRAVLRVIKPGGYLTAFASTRGFAEMSVAIQGAGFVTHPMLDYIITHPDAQTFLSMLSKAQLDTFLQLLNHNDVGGMLGWVFGSGFPKATRVKAKGFDGFRYGGQALKPAIEPIFMGQKPFSETTGTANILKHGTGAVNIDGCRVASDGPDDPNWRRSGRVDAAGMGYHAGGTRKTTGESLSDKGRWPANLIHDGSDEVIACFPDTGMAGKLSGNEPSVPAKGDVVFGFRDRVSAAHHADEGSASRFFYSSKADSDDRIGSKHPTVKPVDLMRYLVRLVTPPGGTVLDPFAGTGTTGEAAWREGMKAILIEREPEYQTDIAERMRLCLSGVGEKKREIAKRKAGDAAPDIGPLFGGTDTPPWTDEKSTTPLLMELAGGVANG